TVACVVGRIFAPASGNVMMDAFSIIPYPGDASSEEYEDNLPDDTSVTVWAIGAVLNNTMHDADSSTCRFNIAVADYIREGSKPFFIECVPFLVSF
ncbi:hypothetical protein JB92DRAFT_2774885, partial [Gautieria morchelliformis]